MEGWRSAAILSVPLTAPHQALSLTDIRMKSTGNRGTIKLSAYSPSFA